jgi:hypothetical protein
MANTPVFAKYPPTVLPTKRFIVVSLTQRGKVPTSAASTGRQGHAFSRPADKTLNIAAVACILAAVGGFAHS